MRVGSLAAILSLVVAPTAAAKFAVHLAIRPGQPHVGELVTIRIRTGDFGGGPCNMRVVAVAPGASVQRALDALVIDHVRTAPALGLRVVLHRESTTAWIGTVRFGRSGRWRVIVPNWCAGGYAIPQPATETVVVG